jgi:putative Mg2+ transporter-C (MgtC) family protein
MNSSLEWGDVLLRLGVAFVTGLVIGLEREQRGRAAGLRTTTLVCVAAAVGALLSHLWFIDTQVAGAFRLDPGRLAAGILTGMGFLGAGTILRQGNAVRGLTTAAMLWYVTILGLAYGSGYLALGLIGFGMVLVIVYLLPPVERRVNVERYAALALRTDLGALSNEEARNRIQSFGLRVMKVELEYDAHNGQQEMRYEVEFTQRKPDEVSSRLLQSLLETPGVRMVRWS